ncbi:hypothetical protein KIN20_025643 [Parelaphostrongylus tenuis]|uniref:Protein CNPPD1 n=1 Tax=Parelaphostrongylus tenuis TaxID=148309 RepID=A0AAD5QUK5_PARTN|nr:hypothetical protein KIN20_025643 [Parelaphostrongylus tenuis]
MAPQFPDFRRVRRRIRRTLGYGAKQPQFINLPLSELVVDYFNKRSPFDYMEPETSASISGCGFADPCTLVVAMVYLDRLRIKNKKWFESSDPTDLYLPALVLASKFLHDSDTYDRASNADWAEAANISNQHLNRLEWEFVQKMNWNVMVGQEEFNRWLSFFEYWVASDFVMKNDFCTYNEMVQLSASIPLLSAVQCLASFLGLLVTVYTFSVVSLFVVPCTLANLRLGIEENSVKTLETTSVLPSLTLKSQPRFSPFLEGEPASCSNLNFLQENGNNSGNKLEHNRVLNLSECYESADESFWGSCIFQETKFKHCAQLDCHISDFSVHSFV